MATKTKERAVKTAKKKAKKTIAKRKRLDGVSYDRVSGATCPSCKMQAGSVPGGSITNTLPWEDGLRIRYHVCRRCGSRFKSIETE